MKKYILSIDQGTTSTRAILYDKNGNLIEKSQREIELIYPKNGWVEANALDIWISVVECINQLLIKTNITFKNIDSIGITNQRESIVMFDNQTGLPLYNAIIWQSRQSEYICQLPSISSRIDAIFEKTGLKLNPYFSASKIKFIIDNIDGVKEKIQNNEVFVGTIDTWILYKLTKGKFFKTDYSNASRTLLLNINTLDYDDELLELFEIPRHILPEIQDSSSYFGEAEFFNSSTPITSLIGDQQAALFGQRCFNKGDSKNTYGTGGFMLVNIGNRPILSTKGLLTSVGWKIGDDIAYIIEGSVFIAGASVKRLRDNLKIMSDVSQSENYAYESTCESRPYFVPAFVGLGTPYWDNDVRGAIFNLTSSTTYKEIAKAALEAIAFQTRDVMEVIKNETKIEFSILKADGGASENNYLMQFQANILDLPVKVAPHSEVTSFGAALLAGLFTNFYTMKEIGDFSDCRKVYESNMDSDERDNLYNNWKKAVLSARSFKTDIKDGKIK